MKHLGTKTLETDRLILRQFVINDSKYMYQNWANDDEVTKYLMWKSHESIEISKNVLADWIENYSKENFYQWAIALKETNEPIGSISVVGQNDEIKMVHVGYCIGKRWWHKGIASESLKTVIKYFFEEIGVNRIESRHDPNNPNSGKVMAKCGMNYEGTMRQADWNNQGVCDGSIYGITAKDYFQE